MKSIVKWLVIIAGGIVVLAVAAVIIIPKVIDVTKYKPVIEQKVAEATGRSFSIGEDIDLSLFPWVGVKLTDLHFGNPAGYDGEDMISIDTFEVRLRVVPLLSKQVEVKTFVMDRPVIVLEKTKSGQANWEGIGSKGTKPGKTDETKKSSPSPDAASSDSALPISKLIVETFAITNGQLTFTDKKNGKKNQVSDLNLVLGNISLDQPVDVKFEARIDGNPLSLKGTAGPIGQDPGKGDIAVDMVLSMLEHLKISLKGEIQTPAQNPGFDFAVDVADFSPRKLFSALKMEFPVQTADASVLRKVGFKAAFKGNTSQVAITGGRLVLDDSLLTFTASAKAFSKPDLAFDVNLDQIDVDRYLPPPSKKDQSGAAPAQSTQKSDTASEKSKKIDYDPLRRLVLDGKAVVGKLKASGATVEDIKMHVTAKNGIIKVDPVSMNLYQGSVAATVNLDVRASKPVTSLHVAADGIQAGPLIKDTSAKEIIEGTLTSNVDITLKGDSPDDAKSSLNGNGQMLFTDGAIIGIDLADSVRNVGSVLGMAETVDEKPKTDFAELKIPFAAKSGLVAIDGTSLSSPLLRVLASGTANLASEVLDLRVEPKFVATLKGQGDTETRSGLMVPVLITGSFASPKVRPDVKGMLSGGNGSLDTEALKQEFAEDPEKALESQKENIEKQVKGILGGFSK